MLAVAVVWKKRLSTPSTTASEIWDHVGECTACIDPNQLVLLDVGYVVDNVLLPFQGVKRVVFLAILAVARMVIWTKRKKGLYEDAKFSHRDLIYSGPRGVMVKAMNCRVVVREFVLQSRYYVHFWANTLGKGMNPLIPPAMG